MLDQNTDRMWYVIGAVIVGAALIFLMNGTFPTLFANIGETFEGKVSETTEMTDGIRPVSNGKLLGPEDLTVYGDFDAVEYDEASGVWTMTLPDVYVGGRVKGFQVNTERQAIPWGHRYTLTYDVWIPDGRTDMEVHTDINNYVKGTDITGSFYNDNDVLIERRLNGQALRDSVLYIKPEPGRYTRITTSYVNADLPHNGEKDILYDNSLFGVRNRSETGVTIKIKNIRVSVTAE